MQSRIDQRPGNTTVLTDDDRFIDRAELCTLVPYSPNHFLRLEKAGVFPLRIVLGPKRVAWLEREVFEWIASKKVSAPTRRCDTEPPSKIFFRPRLNALGPLHLAPQRRTPNGD